MDRTAEHARWWRQTFGEAAPWEPATPAWTMADLALTAARDKLGSGVAHVKRQEVTRCWQAFDATGAYMLGMVTDEDVHRVTPPPRPPTPPPSATGPA